MPLSDWVRKLFRHDAERARAAQRRPDDFVQLRVRRMEERRVFTAVPAATNLNAAQTYVEDTSLNLTDIVVTDDSPTITATLTLSDPAAGLLTTGTFGGLTSTYNSGSGVWSAIGSVTDVNAALAAVTFVPATDYNAGFTISTSIQDGDNPAVTGSKAMTGTPVNDPPTLTTTTSTPTYTEGTAAVSLFSATAISTVETGQTITRLDLTVSNVTDGSAEILRIDGTDIALVAGSGTTATNAFSYTVSGTGTMTVSLTKVAGVSTAAAQSLVDGITYRNSSQTPTAAARTVTLTRIDDSGSNTNPNVNTTTLSAASTVTVAAVNSPPTLTTTTSTPTYTEGGTAASLFSATSVSTVESGQTITRLDLTVSNVADGAAEILRIDGTDIALVAGSGTTATNGFAYNVSVAAGTATISLTKVAGVSTAAVQTMVNGATYRNTSQDPTAGSRTVTLTRIDDSGSATLPNVNTTTLSAASTVTVAAVNDPPTLTTTTSTPTFTEGGSAVSLFSTTTVSTVESSQTITRLDLTVSNVSGGGDILNIDGTDVSLVNGGSGTTATNGFSYTVSVATGTATVSLTKAAGVTSALAATMVDGITYRNSSQTPTAGSRVVTLTRIDDSGSNSAPNVNTTTLTAASTVTVAAVDDGPTLTTTPSNPTYTEDGGAASLFSGTTASTVETGQTLTRLDLTISNVSDGSAEILRVDGTDIALVAGSGTTATNGFAYTVSVAAGTATISLTKAAGVSGAALQTMVNGLAYRNTSQDPTAGARTVTLTRLDDSGSATLPNVNTTTLSEASTVTVAAVNDPPTLTTTTAAPTFTEGGSAVSLFSATAVSTVEAGQTITRLNITVSNVSGGGDVLNIDGTAVSLVNGVSGTTATNGFAYTVSVTTGTATVSLTKAVGVSSATLAAMVDGITYSNSSQNPTAGSRVVTLTRIDDSGSNSNPNVNTTTLTAASTVTVVAVNSAPTMTAVNNVADIDEDISTGANTGTLISDLIAGQFSDVDGPLQGIAVVGASNAFGTWQYTTDGTNWNPLSGTPTAARLLAADATTRIRFVPGANYNGPSGAFQFRAWDGFTGTAGGTGNASTTGGTSAYGAFLLSLGITVTAVNDPPTLTTTTSSPTFTEGGTAVSLFSATSASTFEAGQTITRLDLTVSNVSGGGDVLNIDGTAVSLTNGAGGTTTTNGLTYSVTVSSGTATVSLTSVAGVTTAALQTLVDGITYVNTSDNPTAGSRVVTLTRIDDNGSNTAPNDNTTTLAAASSVTVAAVNDAPVVTATSTDVSYSKGSITPIVIDSGITVTDADSPSLVSATVNISNKQTGDTLSMVSGFTSATVNVSIVNNATTSRITMSAKPGQSPTAADFQAALRAVRFATGSITSGLDRTVTFVVNDGSLDSNTETYTINVDKRPVLTVPGTTITYTEDGASASIAPTGVIITDDDDSSMYGATITLASASATDVFEYGNLPAKIMAQGTPTLVGNVLTLTLVNVDDQNPGDKAEWQAAIQSIKYHTTSDTPVTTNRTMTFTVFDGQLNSNSQTRSLRITAANDPPVMTSSAGKTTYTEDAAGVVIDSGLTLVDPDDTNMNGATVTIASATSDDQLVFVNQNGITGGYSNGVLTLSGSATKANYLAALQSVKYHNTNNGNPTPGDRTISFVVNDGSVDSVAVTKIVTVVAVNDAPVLTGANNLTAIDEDLTPNNGQLVGDLISGRVSDPDGGSALQGIAVTAVVDTNGVWQYSTDSGTTWTAFGTVSGTASRLLASDGATRVRFVPNANYNGSSTGGITFRAWDRTSGIGGGTADTSSSGNNGGTTAFSTASFTSTVTVNAVNDAPVLAGTSNLTTVLEDVANASNPGTLVSTLVAGQITDIDGTLTGIAVTSVDNTNGTWQYSVDGGTNWISFGTPTAATARLLQADAQTRIRFNPNADFNGTVLGLTFRAWDGTSGSAGGTGDATAFGTPTAFSSAAATASITITPVNDPPVRTSGPLTPISINEDFANITAASLGLGGLTYSNGGGSDENGQTRTYTITGIPSYITLWNGATQVVAGTPTATLTLAQLQGLTYRTLLNVSGSGSNITWTVQDSGGTANGGDDTLTESLAVTVVAVNDAPTFAVNPPANVTIPQNQQATLATFRVADVDNPISALTVTAFSFDTNIIDNTPAAIDVVKAADGTVTVKLTPTANASGNLIVRISVSDGTDSSFFDIDVRVNDPPTFTSFPSDQTITEDVEKQVDVTLTVADAETPAANLVVTATSSNQNIIPNSGITVGPASPTDGTRTLHIVPADNWAGDVTITVRVTDGGGVFFERTFVVHITAVNDPPIVQTQNGTTNEDTPLVGALTAQTGDNERPFPVQGLRYELFAGPLVGSVVINSDGTFTYTPRGDYSGFDQFLFRVIDDGTPTGIEQSTIGVFNITVDPVADQPNIPTNITITGDENTLFTLGLNVQPSDQDGSEAIIRVKISNVHPDFQFFYADGRLMTPTILAGRGEYDMTYGEFMTLRIYAPDNFHPSTDIRFLVTATSQELGFPLLTATKAEFVPVLIRNVAPTISQLFASNVDSNATTNLTSTIHDAPRDTFNLEIRWGVSTTGFPSTTFISGLSPNFTQIARSFQFLVAPNPADPSAPIQIELVATDKDGGVATRTVTIQVPGTGIPTPIVRDLGIIDAPSLLRAYSATETPDVRTTIPTAPSTINDRRSMAQRVAVAERSVELRKVKTDGEVDDVGYRLPLDVLDDLPKFLANLPDGRYRLSLKENDFTMPRTLADVVVFRGRAVSEGDLQADRPPKQTLPVPTQVPNVPPVAKTPGANDTSADLPMEDEIPVDGADGPSLRGPGFRGPGLRGPTLREPIVPESNPELQELRGRAP